MLIIFELSKEHNFLPEAEVFACFEALDVNCEKILLDDGILVLKADDVDDFIVELISKRLAMTHHVSKVLEMCKPNEADILKTTEKVSIEESSSFAVRVSIKDGKFNTMYLERSIGSILYKKGGEVELKNPDRVYRVIITSDLCFICTIVHSVDGGQFVRRRPHLRPFFYPGVVLPKIARTMVNLSRIGYDEVLFDPFCGTGGILIEAGTIGCKVIGGDFQKKMVLGTRTNLYNFDISSEIILGDACNLALKDNSVDAVVIDPPYGRSAQIKAKSLEYLYEKSIEEIHRILKINRRVVIASYAPLNENVKEGYKVTEEYLLRVHKSLTRHITVLLKVQG